MASSQLLPIPPTGTLFFDKVTGQVSLVWQNYLRAIEGSLSAGFAPRNAPYWTATGDAILSNEQNLGLLASGLLLLTTTLGVATPSTVPLGTVGQVLTATGTGAPTFQAPAASGTVTNAAALTANQLVIGGGAVAVAALGTLGTTTTVLHGNAGAPFFGAVELTTDVSGVLPVANGGTGVAAIAGADTQVIFNNGGAYAGDVNFTFDTFTGTVTVAGLDTGPLTAVSGLFESVAIQAPGSSNPLDITAASGGTGFLTAQVTNTGGTFSWGVESVGGGGVITGGLSYASFVGAMNASALQFATNATARLTILSGGEVGINTTTQAAALAVNGGVHVGGDSNPGDNNLQVDGTASITGALSVSSNSVISGTGAAANNLIIRTDSTNSPGMTFQNNGGVGLALIDANNAKGIDFIVNGGSTFGLEIDATGALRVRGHVAGTPTFVAGDKYLLVDANGYVHVSALGPAS